jgi:hypothetical protein
MPRYQKGKPAGPGRPAGSRNKSTAWIDAVGHDATEALIRTVLEAATGGDMRAASIVLARTWPHRRGRPVELDLPSVEKAGGLVQAQAAVVAALARGELTPDEAAAVASLLENQRRAIEMHDLEKRLRQLEEERKADSRDSRPRAA